MKNIYTIKVAFGDTDAAGIVFYPNFYRWMDQASHEFIGKNVRPTFQLLNEGIAFPLLETFCQFKSSLSFDDVVEIHSEAVEIKNKIFKLQHDFVRNGEVVASGYELRAWASKASGKLKAVPIPDDVKEKFGFNVESTI